MSLDVNKVCFKEEQNTSNMREKSGKSQSVTKCCRCGKWDVMHTNVEYLSCGEVEALGYFQLSDMRYDDRNVVTQRVSTTGLQLYLIWTPGQILEHYRVPVVVDLRLRRLLRWSSSGTKITRQTANFAGQKRRGFCLLPSLKTTRRVKFH